MRRAGICLWMMMKRMGKHPVYWVLLLLFPTASFVVPKLNKAVDEEQILVGYVMEESGGKLLDGIEYKLQEGTKQKKETAEGSQKRERDAVDMPDGSSLFQYIKYTNIDGLKEDILMGEVSCGIVFDKNFAERLMEQDYRHCITLYLPEGMNVGGMVQEDVFARVYQAYSAFWYAELLEQRGYHIKPEEVLQKFSEYQNEGEVFAVNYEESEKGEEEVQNAAGIGRGISSVLPVRGILAFLTFMSASLGALEGSRDRKRGTGRGIRCGRSLSMAAVGAPVLPAVLFLAGGMIFADVQAVKMSYAGEAAFLVGNRLNISGGFIWETVLMELGSAVVYGLILWLFAMLFSRVISEKLLEGIMPCFLLIVVLCCPIFFDLGETIPLMGGMSNLFPITWYLRFWG